MIYRYADSGNACLIKVASVSCIGHAIHTHLLRKPKLSDGSLFQTLYEIILIIVQSRQSTISFYDFYKAINLYRIKRSSHKALSPKKDRFF